jgi:ABC-2 type transport system permease protein
MVMNTAVVRATNRQVGIELAKMRTTPALYVSVGLSVVLSVVAAVTTIALAGKQGTPALGTVDNVVKVLSVSAVTSMVMLVMGILVTAGEFRTRTAVGTYLAEPRRVRVVVAKLLAVSVLGTVVGAVSFGAALAVAVPMYSARGVHTLPVDVVRLYWGSVVATVCFGLLGVALGSLTRNTVGAVIGGLVWIQVVEVAILQNVAPSFGRWLPTEAAVSLTGAGSQTAGLLAPGLAALVLVAWAAVITAGSVALTVPRDVA